MPRSLVFHFTILVCLISCLKSKSVCAQAAQDSVLVNLENEWLIYNNNIGTFTAYVANTGQLSRTISFILSQERVQNQQLVCELHGGTSLFIEQKIVEYFPDKAKIIYDLDSLFSHYQGEDIFVTVYNKSLEINKLKTYLVPKNLVENDQTMLSVYGISIRKDNIFKNFYILSLILVLIMVSIVYAQYPKHFRELWSISKIFNFRPRYEKITGFKILSASNILIIFTHSLLISYLIIVIYHAQGDPLIFLKTSISSLSYGIWRWISMAVIIFFLILFKYFVIVILTGLMKLRGFENIHFFEFVRISIFIYNLALICVTIFLLGAYHVRFDSLEWIIYLVVFLSVLRIVILFFKFLRLSTFRNFYLFSYLCTTEILPFIVGIKVFVL